MIPELDLQLTLEQEFQLQLLEIQVHSMSDEHLKLMVLQTSQLLMMKDNVIRSLMHKLA